MADADFIFQTNIEQVAAEIKNGLKSISDASNIPQTKAGKNLLSGISEDVQQETMRLAQQVRAYKEQLDELQRTKTPLGQRQSLAQYTNEQLDQSRAAFRTSALNRARGAGIPTSDVASLVTEMEKAFLNRAANEVRARTRVAAGTPRASYEGQASDVRDNPQTRDIQRRYARALEDQARAAETTAKAQQQTAAAAEQTARATTAGAKSAEQAAQAQAENARALQDIAEVNKQNARRAQQQAAQSTPTTTPPAAQPTAPSAARQQQQTRPAGDIVDPRTGVFREPTGPYQGPWRERTYQTSKVGQAETHHILDMAQSEGVDPGFTLTKNGIRVHDPNRARYELDGAYQAAADNVKDEAGEDKKLYTQRRDSLRKLIDAIGAHRDELVKDLPSEAALADPEAARRRQPAGGAGGGSKPPTPPAPPEPPQEPEEPEPRREAPKVIHAGNSDDQAQEEWQRLENALAARVADPNDPLRAISPNRAYDPTTSTFYARRLSERQPEPELTRPVDIQNAQETLANLVGRNERSAYSQEETRAQREVIDQERALAREITEARRADPNNVVRVTGTGGVRTGIEADLRDQDNPRYFERVNAKRLRELDPQNPDDVLKLDEATRNLARMRAEAAQTTSKQIAQAETAAHAEDAARTQRQNALNLQAARQANPEQIVNVKGTRGVTADLRGDADNPDYYAPVGRSGGMRRLDPSDSADEIRINQAREKLVEQQTAEYKRSLSALDAASERAAKEKNDAQKAFDTKQQKAIADQIKAQQKSADDQAKQFERDWNAAQAENRVRNAKAERAFGQDYDAATKENTAHDQRELHRDLIATKNAMPDSFQQLPGGVTASFLDPNNPQFFQKAGRGQTRYLDPADKADQSTIDEAKANLARRQADQQAADAAKDKADADKLAASQTRDYARQQTRDAADRKRQDAQAELDAQRAQRAGLESRLLAGDTTVSDVPRRGIYAGGYVDRSLDPNNPLVYERQSRGGLTQVDPATEVGQAKVGQALLAETEAIDRANAATIRRAKAEERSEASLDKQVATFGGGGIGAGFVRGFTSGGFGGNGEDGLEGLARSAGTTLKYTALYKVLGLVSAAGADVVKQLLDANDSITQLQVAMNTTEEPARTLQNNLQDIAATGGANVGEAMDVAASGVRAFRDSLNDANNQVTGNDLEEGFARQAQRIAALSNTTLTDAAGNLKAATSGFGLSPNEAGFRQVTDAIAGGKLAGGGQEQDLSQFLASSAETFHQAGFNINEASSIGSRVISSLDETGTLAATRLSRLFSILQGSSGKSYLRDLNTQIAAQNQARPADQQVAQIDTSASAKDQVVQLANAYKTLTAAQQQVLLTKIGGTGQSRELKVLLETVNEQIAKAANGFDDKGLKQWQQLLDNIRQRLSRIGGDFKAIMTNVAESGFVAPFLAALAAVEPLAVALKEITQALHWMEGFGPFKWAEEIAVAVVALRAATGLMGTIRQQGISGLFGMVEGKIAPGRALTRQRLDEAQEAAEVGGIMGSRRLAGGGRFDVGVETAATNLERGARVTGLAQDNLVRARTQRADSVEKLSKLNPLDPAYAAMEQEIARLDQIIDNRTARLARLTDAIGRERGELDEAIKRQGLAQGINQRYDRSAEGLAGARDQRLRQVDEQEQRDQRRIGRVGGAPSQDFDALRQDIHDQYQQALGKLTDSKGQDLEELANKDLKAPTGFKAARQQIRDGARNFFENIDDRGLRGAMQQGPTVGQAWTQALNGMRGGMDAAKRDFEALRSQGVNPLKAALRSFTGYDRADAGFQGLMGRLNGRDPEGNAPLQGTRTQRAGNFVKNIATNELGWLGGGMLALTAAMQVADNLGQIHEASRTANDVLSKNGDVSGSAKDLTDSAAALNAAASNLDEATSGFMGWLTDNLFNSGNGTQQAIDLRGVADFRDAAGTRIASLEQGAAQSGDKNRYVDAIDLSSPDELTASVKQLTDAGVPAAQVMGALTGSIERMNAAAAQGISGQGLSPVQREKMLDAAGEAAGTGLSTLKSQNQVPFGGNISNWVNQHGGNWLKDHTPGFLWGGDNNSAADLQNKVDLSNVNVQDVEETARLTAAQVAKQGANFSTDKGLAGYSEALDKALAKTVTDAKQRAAIVAASSKGLGGAFGNFKSLDDPFGTAIALANTSISGAQNARQDTQLNDQLKALQTGTDFDQGVHATQVYRDWLKRSKNDTIQMLKNAGFSQEIIDQIINLYNQADTQAQVDQLQEARQKAQQSIQRRTQRQSHDLANVTDPGAIEARRNKDTQASVLDAIGADDPDTAAQLLSVLPPDQAEAQIKAARDALQKQIDAEKDKLTPHSPFGGSDAGAPKMKPSPHLLHLEHEQTLLGLAEQETTPQYTAGDTAAAKQAADAARSGSQAATDAANVATAEQGVLDAQRQYGYGSHQYWDAVGQVETAKRTQATDELERAIANRDILTDSSSALAQANAAIRDANDRRKQALGRGDKDEAEHQRLLGIKAEQDRKSAQLELGFLRQRARIDVTNPALLAKQEADEAQQRADAARQNPHTGADHQAQLDAQARDARNNSEKVAHDQWLSDLQEKDKLGDISHRAYIQSLQADIARLKAIKKLTYQQQQMLNADRDALLAANNQLSGQFNLGNITLPSVYEVRRNALAQAQGANAGAGVPGSVAAPVQSSGSMATTTAGDTVKTSAAAVVSNTNNVTINGADFARVVDYLNKVFGKTTRVTTTPRKA